MNIRSTLVLLSLLTVAARSSAQTDIPKWVPLPMDTPRAIRLTTPLGVKPLTDRLHLSVGLPYADKAGIQRFVDDVSNPKSPDYRKFITPTEVGQRFGLAASSVKKVSDYLESQGMKVRLVAKNRLSILADATVGQAQSAFRTTISEFSVIDPRSYAKAVRFSYLAPPSVPLEISSYVTYVGGLENVLQPKRLTLTPNQLRTLYSVAPMYSHSLQGQGRTVGISNWDGYRLSNVPLEYQQFNLPTPPGGAGTNITVESIDGQDGNTATPNGEGDIDIQTVLAMAPLCNLIIYDDGGPNTQDLIGVLTQEADDNTADLISESYGWEAGYTTLYEQAHSIHLSMSAQGITYLCASGDTGAQGIVGAPYPDEDPEVLVVGGTSVYTDGAGNRESEVVWNNEIGAGGGGWTPNSDPFNLLPSYQKGNGVPTDIPYRLVPDVSLDADPDTGYEIFMEDVLELGWGGTSCASPTTAGSLADCEQQIIADGGLAKDSSGHQRFGRIQDLLYSYNGDPIVFNDIVSGNNGTLPNGSDSNAGPGWDTASGWGTLNFSGLADRVLGLAVPVSFTINPTTVIGGTPVTGTITINEPAPKGGTVIAVSSSDPAATVPATVTIAAGSTSATFTINTIGGTSTTLVSVSASASGVTLTAELTVNPSTITSITISPNSVVGGNQSMGTATLNGPAPAGGLDISLSSSSLKVLVPQHVEIPEGATSDTFTIDTSAVTSTSTATITGTYQTGTASATITLSPTAFTGFTISPNSVAGGDSATGTVTLNGSASAGGLTVNLSSSSPVASLPATVTIPAGASSATVTISTTPVTTGSTVTLTATQGGTSFTASLMVAPAGLAGIALSPNSVMGGSPATGTVTLTGPANAAGLTVNLSSNNPNAKVPATVTVPNGSTSATFTVTTLAVSSNASVVISGAQGANTQSAPLTITAAALTSLSVSPSSVGGGSSSTGTVSLNGQAGPGGTVVSLASSSPSATLRASVTVPAGSTSASFQVSTSPVATNVVASITGSQGSNTQSATLTITAATLSGLTIAPSSVAAGSSATVTATLSGSAGPGGAVVNLASSSTAATLPATVTIPAGATSANFKISTTSITSTVVATITGGMGSQSLTAALTITPSSLSSLTISPNSVVGGSGSIGTASLSGPAGPSGTVVTLASSSSSATVPSSVNIPAGATSATFSISTSAVGLSVTATITGTQGPNSQSATLTIAPASLSSLSVSPNSITGGNSATGTATLNGPAGPGGTVVSLASNNANVSLPASVTIAAGANTASFNIATTAVSTSAVASITGTQGTVTQTASLSLKAISITGLSLSPNTVVGGSTSTGAVTLNTAAPASGTVVTLNSNSPSVSVPATLTIPSGATTGNFSIATLSVTSSSTGTITAVYGGSSASAGITVQTPLLVGISLSPSAVVGGNPAVGTVTLARPAPSGGAAVALNSSSSAVPVPSTVNVAAGSTTATFTVTTSGVSLSAIDTITGTLNGTARTASLTVQPASLLAVVIAPGAVPGGTQVVGTVSLTGQAPPGGVTLSLLSSSKDATVPASVTIAGGSSSTNFDVTTKTVTASVDATVTAKLAAIAQSTLLTIQPASLVSLSASSDSVVGGSNVEVSGNVSLNGPAAATGDVVTLRSSDSKAISVPATVKVANGALSAAFAIRHLRVTTAQVVTLTASFHGASQTTTITVNPFLIESLTLSPSSVTGGSSVTGAVVLNATAGSSSGSILIKLESSAKSATVPATFTVPVGSSSGHFTLKTSGVSANTEVTVSATSGSSSQQATLSISAPLLASVSVTPSSVKGGSSTDVSGVITLSGPAPSGGLVVKLSSSDPSVAAVPASVTVAAGRSTVTFKVSHHEVSTETSVSIGATISGVTQTATLTVTP